MSEKYRKIVNVPHRGVGKLKEKIQETNPQTKFGKIARGAGIGVAGISQFLMWLGKYIVLDNHVTRAGEQALADINVGKNKNGNDKKFPKFIKNNPNFTAVISWWVLLASLGVGVKATVNNKTSTLQDDEIDDDKIENIEWKYEDKTLGGYCEKLKPVTPFLIANLIANEGVRVNESGLHVVYDDYDGKPLKPGAKPKGTATIGFGSTMLKDGTPVTSYTKPITTEEAYELARWHLEEGETYFGMYCYDTAFETIDINTVSEALAIASIMYNGFTNLIEPKKIDTKTNYVLGNRFAMLRDLYKDKGTGLSDDEVLAAFQKYPATHKYSFGDAWLGGKSKQDIANTLGNFLKEGRGLWVRRWIEAGLLTGDLSPDVLLNCPVDGLPAFLRYKQRNVKNKNTDKSAFWLKDANGNMYANRATYAEFLAWLEHPVDEHGDYIGNWKHVRDYMPDYALGSCENGICELKPVYKTVKERQVEKETYVLSYEDLYANAIGEYKKHNYDAAYDLLQNLSNEYPNNALLHNDLAATCNHLKRYDDAIKHAKEILYRIGDKSQYAAAQYNAGFAYEMLGQLDKALANYNLAVQNGNVRVQADVNRVQKKLNKSKSRSKSVSFNEAAGRVQMKIANVENANAKNDADRS